MRAVLQRKLLSDLTATLDYSYGGVLDLTQPDVQLQDARNWIRTERHSFGGSEVQRNAAQVEDPLGCLLPLCARAQPYAGRPI